MAMTAWSTVAANNVLANTGINMDENCAPSVLNDSIREIMAVLKTAIDTGNITATGTTAAIFNTVATTVNAFGAASVALNIGHASAAAAFPGGITIPTGKTLAGAGNLSLTGTGHTLTLASGTRGLYVAGTLNNATAFGLDVAPTMNGGTLGAAIHATAATVAASFTQTDLIGIQITAASKGAGSTITNLYGLKIENQNAGGTLNYAIHTSGGRIHFGSLPTSSAGLASGDIWANSNVLTVVP